jgi:hypothetical protein
MKLYLSSFRLGDHPELAPSLRGLELCDDGQALVIDGDRCALV